MEDFRDLPKWAWLPAIALVAGGFALAVAFPGSFAFWVAPIPLFAGLMVLGAQSLTPWSSKSRRRRRGAFAEETNIGGDGAFDLPDFPG